MHAHFCTGKALFGMGCLIAGAATLLSSAVARAEPTPARTGFQASNGIGAAHFAALRDGSDAPSGSWYAVPLDLRIGAKVSRQWFAGVNGSVGRFLSTSPDNRGSSTLMRGGLVLQGHIRPGALIDPWIEYGMLVDYVRYSVVYRHNGGDDRWLREPEKLLGLSFLHLALGGDLRLGAFGIGPFVDFSAGAFLVRWYSHSAEKLSASDNLYLQLGFGLRAVLWP